jgi:hypothetical protein
MGLAAAVRWLALIPATGETVEKRACEN